MVPSPSLWPRLIAQSSRFASILISLVWLAAGINKVVDPDQTAMAIRAHAVLPAECARWVMPLGVIEVLLGIAVVVWAPPARPKWAPPGVFACSLLLLSVLTAYLAAIPHERLVASGCGCSGLQGLVVPIVSHSLRVGSIAFNVGAAMLHLPVGLAWLAPRSAEP